MAWLLLFLAGLPEVCWVIGMKYSDGFSRLWPSVGTVIAMVLSFWLLATALKTLPVGTAYGVWVGIGAIGTAIAGIVLFAEPVNVLRVVSLLCIVAGIAGLKLSTS